mgnify:CR=1 FL=1
MKRSGPAANDGQIKILRAANNEKGNVSYILTTFNNFLDKKYINMVKSSG